MGKAFGDAPSHLKWGLGYSNLVIFMNQPWWKRTWLFPSEATLLSLWGQNSPLSVVLRPDWVSLHRQSLSRLSAVKQSFDCNTVGRKEKKKTHRLFTYCIMSALFNQKNHLYYFCKKSNEHCPFISPKVTAHVVFAFHPRSGEGRSAAPKGSVQKGAEGRPPLLLWELSFVFPQDVEARRTDFTRRPRSTFSPIKFLLDLKINTCTMIWYDFSHPRTKWTFYKLDVFSLKTVQCAPVKDPMAEVWL